MRKKILAVVAATVITTLAFTGCGKSNESKSGSDKGVTGEINVISREENSGTRGAFVELMGIVDENDNDITTQTAEVTNSTSVMLSTVAQNEKAIGYVSLGSLSTDVKALKVDGVDATTENIKSGQYKVARPFNLAYQDGKLTKLDEDFIKYIMSDEGQKIVDKEGYIKMNPDVSIEIQESGSSAGIQSAIEGATEIGMSSRELKDEEVSKLVSKQIAMDGIAVIINKANKLDNITSDQVKSIYTGETTTWDKLK